jgi:hypothetical protein
MAAEPGGGTGEPPAEAAGRAVVQPAPTPALETVAGAVVPPVPGPTPFAFGDATGTGAAIATRTGSWVGGLDPRGWRTTIAAGFLMVATVLTVNLVNAAVPLPADPAAIPGDGPALPGDAPDSVDPPVAPVEPGPVVPGGAVEVGGGFVLYPPAGWTVVSSEAGAVVLQKGGVVLVALATAWDDDPGSLADGYSEAFFATGQFQSSSPETGTLGNGIPAVVISWTGIIDGGQYDGVIAGGANGGTGMILNVVAPKGQLGSVADDLETIGETLRIVTGGT